ncbi:bifunctional endoribonuclease/protein kinase ire1 [Coemansia interrupta]|uniref:non-specific serine/threonine protein kinase n=1 Tax=Coemansia interrupta TaxID=1126814 RepID=A0A9W8LQ32_9FUNG|nr:bifunctional endoribonuclease/protein kinase ire1 [Coemansia interrupta]
MDWLNTAIWNLCMSMLPHRNARALLVPIICVAFLAPFAATTATASTVAAIASGFVLGSITPTEPVAASASAHVATSTSEFLRREYGRGSIEESIEILAQQSQIASPAPTVAEPELLDPDEDEGDGIVFSKSLKHLSTAPTRSSNSEQSSRQHEQNKEEQQRFRRSRRQGGSVVFLERDGSEIVPRKFTIPEPSIVAEADEKHIAILPAKPHQAIVSQHRLLRRDAVENAGISLADTMIVITVDGRMYGVSRKSGSIVWRRDGLVESANIYSETPVGSPRGMVWTRGRPASGPASVEAPAEDRDENIYAKLQGNSTAETNDLYEEDEEEDEEEWLLEQGIDWRSDSQAQERRRQWLERQKAKVQQRRGGNGNANSFGDPRTDNFSEPLYIAEPGGSGGALYVYSMDAGLKKLQMTIQDLVDRSPVQVQGVLYTGTKEASFAALDLNSGELLDIYDDSKVGSSLRVLLAEKLNRVRIFPSTADHSRALQWEWELYHRSVQPPPLDSDIDLLLAEMGDAAETLGETGGPTKFVMTNDGGFVMIEALTGVPLWAQEFDAPVVSVFDVFSVADTHGDSRRVNHVVKCRDLSPAQQQARFQRWRQLHEIDTSIGFGSSRSSGRGGAQEGRWRTGSSGGNVLAEAFWERASRGKHQSSSRPQFAYVGKLRDTLYTLTAEEFPLVDHATLTSSLLLSLAQARRDKQRYPALLQPEWWDRWSFLTRDAVVLRVLQDARAYWLADTQGTADGGLVAIENRFEQLIDVIERHHMEAAVAAAEAADRMDESGNIVGIHPLAPSRAGIEGAVQRHVLDAGESYDDGVVREGFDDDDNGNDSGSDDDGNASKNASGSTDDPEDDWPWWRYVGHYTTRVAAFIGYAVTFTVVAIFGGALYLLRPRNKRRARMWVDAAGDDPDAPGRRARLRISWALMHRMWATLKEEWHLAIEDAWRNPNAAAVLRRTGVKRRESGSEHESDEPSRQSNVSPYSSRGSASLSNSGRRGSASASPTGLGVFGADDSDHSSSFERVPSGAVTPRRNSTGTLPMTPLKQTGSEVADRLRLGAITLTDQVLGYGSHGTVVYRGTFQGRAVAVKRLLLDFYDVADHEVQVLQESDSHPNVIRYFCTERQDHFMYIALELCCGSLADAVMRAPKAQVASQLLTQLPKMHILRQLARGLHHLHALKLVHRDIKPQNILIAPPPHRRRKSRLGQTQQQQKNGAEGGSADSLLGFGDTDRIVAGAGAPRVLISDFGLSRILDDDESSFANTYTVHGLPLAHAAAAMPAVAAPGAYPPGMIGGFGGGTVGWRAPECFDSPEARMAITDTDQPTWPSLRPNGQVSSLGAGNAAAADEPSPYVSRGTRSRMRQLAMTTHHVSQLQTDADDPDSTGTNPTNSNSMPFASSSGPRRRMTRAVDLFSMGCVFYYILTDGEHPFGDRLSREQRILSGTPDLRALESSDIPSAIEAVDLIAHMVARQERDRPSAASVLVHPYFWDATQRLAFLQDVSDCLEAEARLIKAAREDISEPPKKPTKPAKKKTGNSSGQQQQQQQQGSNVAAESSASLPGSHAISNESIEDIIAQLPSEQAAGVRRAIGLLDLFEENSEFVMEGPPVADGFQVVGMPNSHAIDAMAEAVGGTQGKGRPSARRRVMWDRRLDPHLRRDLGKFRKYDGTRLRDLLRIIRNKKNHYQDMPLQLRETLGDIPDGYLHYFDSRFPYLLLHCYYFVLEDDSLRTATVFRPYFRPPSL